VSGFAGAGQAEPGSRLDQRACVQPGGKILTRVASLLAYSATLEAYIKGLANVCWKNGYGKDFKSELKIAGLC